MFPVCLHHIKCNSNAYQVTIKYPYFLDIVPGSAGRVEQKKGFKRSVLTYNILFFLTYENLKCNEFRYVFRERELLNLSLVSFLGAPEQSSPSENVVPLRPCPVIISFAQPNSIQIV